MMNSNKEKDGIKIVLYIADLLIICFFIFWMYRTKIPTHEYKKQYTESIMAELERERAVSSGVLIRGSDADTPSVGDRVLVHRSQKEYVNVSVPYVNKVCTVVGVTAYGDIFVDFEGENILISRDYFFVNAKQESKDGI